MRVSKYFIGVILLVVAGAFSLINKNAADRLDQNLIKEDLSNVISGIVAGRDINESIIFVLNDKQLRQGYKISKSNLSIYGEGSRIKGRVVYSESGNRLEDIWPDDEVENVKASLINAQLHENTVSRGRKVFRDVGEKTPPFALYNQDGKLITHNDCIGCYTVINFIFTRCAKPEMCPLSTRKMVLLQEAMKDMENVQLLTITFDPEYDTPGVLRQYAQSNKARFDNYNFLTGDKQAIEDLVMQFGILKENVNGTIDHTVATVLLDPYGEIVLKKNGNKWDAEDFISVIKS